MNAVFKNNLLYEVVIFNKSKFLSKYSLINLNLGNPVLPGSSDCDRTTDRACHSVSKASQSR